MRILGIDVGSKNLGFAISSFSEKNWLVIADSYCLTYPKIQDRLVFIEDAFSKLIEDYCVNVIAYEAPYMRNGKNAMGLYFVSGLITYLAGKYKLPLIALSPKTVKKEVTGTGNAEKKLVESKVLEFFQPGTDTPITFSTDHASDAAGCSIAAFNKLNKG